MKHLIISMITLCMLLLFSQEQKANNILISNVSLVHFNNVDNYAMIGFDISWDNSWNTKDPPENWDAAWIFIKYRLSSGEWQHATLNATDASHTAPSGSIIDAVSDGKGVFMYRSSQGSGTNNWKKVRLRWEYGTDGVADDAKDIEVKVLAVEMVYVPTGSFELGSTGDEPGSFYRYPSDKYNYIVNGESEIKVLAQTDNLYYDKDVGTTPGDQQGPIPKDFPKGYNAFYCMKYEITQGQYAEFLNLLTESQASNRFPGKNGSYRHTISGTYQKFTATAPDRACNFLSWADGTAYCDWSGLRPMTELEFEKACRGTAAAIAGEYAWGTTAIAIKKYSLSNDGTNKEGISENYFTNAGNCSYQATNDYAGIEGPLRVGIFAAHADNKSRETAGASYYGIMELSGNLWERAVTVGNTTGRKFTGLNGDGKLDKSGYADVSYWPDSNAEGSGFRGGVWYATSDRAKVSDRTSSTTINSNRNELMGFRAVRCP